MRVRECRVGEPWVSTPISTGSHDHGDTHDSLTWHGAEGNTGLSLGRPAPVQSRTRISLDQPCQDSAMAASGVDPRGRPSEVVDAVLDPEVDPGEERRNDAGLPPELEGDSRGHVGSGSANAAEASGPGGPGPVKDTGVGGETPGLAGPDGGAAAAGGPGPQESPVVLDDCDLWHLGLPETCKGGRGSARSDLGSSWPANPVAGRPAMEDCMYDSTYEPLQPLDHGNKGREEQADEEGWVSGTSAGEQPSGTPGRVSEAANLGSLSVWESLRGYGPQGVVVYRLEHEGKRCGCAKVIVPDETAGTVTAQRYVPQKTNRLRMRWWPVYEKGGGREQVGFGTHPAVVTIGVRDILGTAEFCDGELPGSVGRLLARTGWRLEGIGGEADDVLDEGLEEDRKEQCRREHAYEDSR